jgi:hypothetical protein
MRDPADKREMTRSASRSRWNLRPDAAKKCMEEYKGGQVREGKGRGDLQIGGRGGEGNCAGGRAGVCCEMRAQLRQEAEQ